MDDYVERTLTYLTDKGEIATIEDAALAELDRPLIILGEPGMGKTCLLQRLASTQTWSIRSAASFVEHPDPAKLAPQGTKLLIDGLDELSAARESDPVYRVLGQLISAGCPPFVLSCRAADWRGAVARQDISSEYPVSPLELTIEPFSEAKAIAYLAHSLGEAHATNVVSYLKDKGISDLLGNPLTLKLFGQVAEQRTSLPETRAALMRAATEIMWNEQNDRHDKSPLSNMDQATALKAAGAACAAYILTGSEAISLRPSSAAQPHVLSASEIQALPAGTAVRTLIGSRLFSPIPGTPDHFRPVHRTVAEYLGAQWLAATATDALTRERIAAMMTFDKGIPASLRGIHAWLAQDRKFAPAVIATDPSGVLSYGDPEHLSVSEGRLLLRALQTLQHENPHFGTDDSRLKVAKGLTHLELREEIRAALIDEQTTFDLRTLLLSMIRGSDLAKTLIDDLRAMALSKPLAFSYGVRYAAAYAMVAFGGNCFDWPAFLDTLVEKGDEDSTRLVLEILDKVGFESISSAFVARAILAFLKLPEDDSDESEEDLLGGVVYVATRKLPDSMVSGVLDAIAAILPPSKAIVGWNGRDGRYELADAVSRLIARQLDIEAPNPLQLLTWLRLSPDRSGYSREGHLSLASYLRNDHEVRRAIQRHAIFEEQEHEKIWSRIWRLQHLCTGLALSSDDIVYFLAKLATAEDRSDAAKDLWREFASLLPRHDEQHAVMTETARLFAKGDAELESYLDELQIPPLPPQWQVEQDAWRDERALVAKAERAKRLEKFTAEIAALRAGDFPQSYQIAKVYLGRLQDVDETLSPSDRVEAWLDSELREAALIGLEAVLHRPDLPTLEQIACSYAESKRWNFIYPMIAGLAERVLNDRDIGDIPLDVMLAVRIGLENEYVDESISKDRVAQAIDLYGRRDPARYERYMRLFIEPGLERQLEHVCGLHSLMHSAEDRMLAVKLGAEWLTRFDKLPARVELELIDVLMNAGQFETLRALMDIRRQTAYEDRERSKHWLAVALCCDFKTTSVSIGQVPVDEKDLLWHLRHRFDDRRGEVASTQKIEPAQLAWVVTQFRRLWPYCGPALGSSTGDTNGWDATQFILGTINRLAGNSSAAATEALATLIADERDDYSDQLRHAADQQRRARRELAFPGVTLERLQDVVEKRPPCTSDDLSAILRHTLARVQVQLHGNDTDSIVKYWRDDGQPRKEDRCTDAMTEDIARLLPDFGITRIPQADMPNGKIADLLYMVGDVALPIECKGQWNEKLWTAAGDQLDAFYVRDWRVQDRGIYLVYWFGTDVEENFRLQPPPNGAPKPETPDQLREALVSSLSPARRGSIQVEVLDLTRRSAPSIPTPAKPLSRTRRKSRRLADNE